MHKALVSHIALSGRLYFYLMIIYVHFFSSEKQTLEQWVKARFDLRLSVIQYLRRVFKCERMAVPLIKVGCILALHIDNVYRQMFVVVSPEWGRGRVVVVASRKFSLIPSLVFAPPARSQITLPGSPGFSQVLGQIYSMMAHTIVCFDPCPRF